MGYNLKTRNYFDSSASKDILQAFFVFQEEYRAVMDACDNRCGDLFCYVAVTGNNKLVKIGITSKPSKRLFYSCVHFGLSSLDYVAIFPGSRELEKVLLYSFLNERLDYVKNKRSIEWFVNKGRINEFLRIFRKFNYRAISKEFYAS